MEYLSSNGEVKNSVQVSLLLNLSMSGWKKDSSILPSPTRDRFPRPALRAKAPAMRATNVTVPTDSAKLSRLLVNVPTDALVESMALLADISISMLVAGHWGTRKEVRLLS